MTAADSHPNRLASNSVRGGTGAALIGTGGALLAISPALPWVHVVLLGDLTLFQLLKFTRHSTGFGWAAVLVGSLFVLVALGVRRSRDWLRLMSFLLAAVVALVAGPGTARLVDLVSHSGGFLGVGAGVIVIALGEIMLLAGAIAPSVETAARVRSAASASDQAPIVGAISVMAEAAEIAAPNSASKEPRSQEQAKPPAVDEASEREAAPPRGSPAPQRVVNDEPKRGTMKKVLIAVPLVLVIAIIGVVWSTSHVEVTVTHPKPPAISWGTNCKLNMELPASMGSGGYPEPFATVKITDAGKNIQEFNAYRLYFWSGGIIVGFWNGHPGTTYESPGESWTSTSNVSSGSGAWEAVEPPESPASGAGVWSAIYEPTGQPMTCTVGSVT